MTTDHLEDRLWFRDTDDFRAGMNLVASLSLMPELSILTFILMSNHVHFVLVSSRDVAHAFITRFKALHARYLFVKYGTKEQLKENGIDIRPLTMADESLERGIAYTLDNSVVANICLHPSEYPWGTGGCFFRAKPVKGTPVSALSARARIRLLHTKKALPGGFQMGDDGFILPESYVNVSFVESLFRTPKRMNYFIQNSSKAKMRLAFAEDHLPSFRDQSILASVPDLCRSLFQKQQPSELNDAQMSELLKQIRYRFSSNANQLARVTGLTYEKAASLLEMI